MVGVSYGKADGSWGRISPALCICADWLMCLDVALMNYLGGISVAKWISVKEKLPEPGVDVLTYREGNDFYEVCYRVRGRWVGESKGNPITHWMPIPAFPGKE